MTVMIIRPYRTEDRAAVEHIQFETYFLGKSGSHLLTNKKRFHKEIAYYLEKEPESCFVAEEKGCVVGYLLGCLDDRNHAEPIYHFVGKQLITTLQLPFMHPKDQKFWFGRTVFLLNAMIGQSEDGKFKTPPNAGHIHINLLPEARGKNVGTKLLKTFFKYAKSKGVNSIHADSFQTRVNPNTNFWIKNGFTEYCKVKTGMWKKQYPNEEMFLVCYLKKLY